MTKLKELPNGSKKTGHRTLVNNFAKCLQKIFTVGLGSKRVMKQSLKCSPHVQHIATLPCEK